MSYNPIKLLKAIFLSEFEKINAPEANDDTYRIELRNIIWALDTYDQSGQF